MSGAVSFPDWKTTNCRRRWIPYQPKKSKRYSSDIIVEYVFDSPSFDFLLLLLDIEIVNSHAIEIYPKRRFYVASSLNILIVQTRALKRGENLLKPLRSWKVRIVEKSVKKWGKKMIFVPLFLRKPKMIISKVRGILSHLSIETKKEKSNLNLNPSFSNPLVRWTRFIFYPRIRKVGRAKDISRFSL